MTARREQLRDLVRECGLDGKLDAARIELLVELLRRAAEGFKKYRGSERSPTSRAKQRQLATADAALREIVGAYERFAKVSETWDEGGPVGSPSIARRPLWQVLASHLTVPHLDIRVVQVLLQDGRRVGATLSNVEEGLLSLRRGSASDPSTRTTSADALATAIEDAAYAAPEFIGGLLRAIASATRATLSEIEAAGQSRKSEVPRDAFMRDVALIFHAVHRVTGRGAKAARTRFVHHVLEANRVTLTIKAVDTRLRKRCFRISGAKNTEAFGEVPGPLDFDASAVVAELSTPPGRRQFPGPLLERLKAASALIVVLP